MIPEHIKSLIYVRTSFDFCLQNNRKYEATLIRNEAPLSILMVANDFDLVVTYHFGWNITVNKKLVAICDNIHDLQNLLMGFMKSPVQFSLQSSIELPLYRWTKSSGLLHLICTMLEGGKRELVESVLYIYCRTLKAKMLDIQIDHDFIIYRINGIWIMLFENTIGVSSYDIDFLVSLLHPTGVFLTEIYCYSDGDMNSFFLLNQSRQFMEYCQINAEKGIYGSFQIMSKPSTLDMDYIRKELL